jgi:hypothetical protein
MAQSGRRRAAEIRARVSGDAHLYALGTAVPIIVARMSRFILIGPIILGAPCFSRMHRTFTWTMAYFCACLLN